MVETGRFPGVGTVAGRTLPAEVVGRFILIVAGLAVHGSGGGMDKVSREPSFDVMACRALPRIVVGRFIDLVTGRTVLDESAAVVKVDLIPTESHMTDSAVCPELAIMGLILSVARNTGRIQTLVRGASVASNALQVLVPADQIEAGQAVIELSLLPVFWRVADCALRPEQALVGIVL